MNWFFILVGYLGLFVYGLVENTRGPVFPDLIQEFGLSDSQGALFFVVSSGSALINNVVFFKLMERIGTLKTMRFYSVIQCIGLLGIGFSASYGQTLIGSVLLGVCFGGLGIAVNLIVTEGSSSKHRRRALSGLHSMYGISSLLAPLFVTLLYSGGLTWRGVFGCIALGPFLVFVVSLMGKGEGRDHVDVKKPVARRWKPSLVYAALVALYVVAEVGASTRLVLFARREAGYSIEAANFLLSGFFLGLLAGRALLAVFKIPLSNRAILALSASTSFVCLGLGLLHDPLWLGISGLPMSVFYPCSLALIADDLGESGSFATSLVIILQSLALVTMHGILGELSDRFGLGRALWIGPLCLALALVLLGSVSLPRLRNRLFA